MRRLAAAALATGALSLIAAAPSEAFSIGGRAWPGSTVTYSTTAIGYSAPVSRAARIINRANVGVRLKRVASPHPLGYWLAHPLTADDLRGLRAIYGS